MMGRAAKTRSEELVGGESRQKRHSHRYERVRGRDDEGMEWDDRRVRI